MQSASAYSAADKAGSSVTPPETWDPSWPGKPSDNCSRKYFKYYHSRKLAPESEGWTSWAARVTARNVISIVQTSASFVYRGMSGMAFGTFARNEVVYHTAGQAIQIGHAAFTSKTRVPIDHERVDVVVQKLRRIQKCHNANLLIDRIQAVYNCGYLSSKGSHDLCQILASDNPTAEKIDGIIRYLTRSAKLLHFEDIYYNNGKKLYQIIVCLTERSALT